jgi:hypothetical protein
MRHAVGVRAARSSWRLIPLADGASPENLDLVRSITDASVRIEAFRGRSGLTARLNVAARIAETTYLFRMDADGGCGCIGSRLNR